MENRFEFDFVAYKFIIISLQFQTIMEEMILKKPSTEQSVQVLEENISGMNIRDVDNSSKVDFETSSDESNPSINSRRPSGFNDVDHLFHIDFMRSMQSLLSHEQRR